MTSSSDMTSLFTLWPFIVNDAKSHCVVPSFAGFYCHEKAGNLTCQNQPLWQVKCSYPLQGFIVMKRQETDMSKSTSVTGQSNTLLSHFHFDTSACRNEMEKNKKIKIKKMHAHLSNLGLLRCLFDWSFQWETFVGDLICPLLQCFCHLWKSCSSSINPCVDFSWTYNQMVDTQDRGEHKHNFAWKKIDSVLSKFSKIETQKRCRVFFEKEEVHCSNP